MRVHAAATVVLGIAATIGLAGVPDVPPLIVGPVVPFLMSRTLRQRARSLRASGLRLRDALLAWTARRAIRAPIAAPAPAAAPPIEPAPARGRLARFTRRTRAVVPATPEAPHAAAVRRAVEDRQAIVAMVGALPRADRKLVADAVPTANALVERVRTLAEGMQRLDESVNTRHLADVDARIARLEADEHATASGRRLALVRRQRESLEELARHRDALGQQAESALLALGTLRLDLVKFRASGGPAALAHVTSATQEARALSRDIGAMLEAQAELRRL